MRRVLPILFLVLALLVSCNGDVAEKLFSEEKYTVMFDPGNGSGIWGITVVSGTVIEAPENPAREGYVFTGWLRDGKMFDFSSRITQDMWLSALWERDVGCITIDVARDGIPADDGTGVVLAGPLTVEGLVIGGKVYLRDVPTGVYEVSAMGFSFGNAEVTLGKALYFNCHLYTVTLSASEGIASVSGGAVVREGDPACISSEVEPGYAFSGWYSGESPVSEENPATVTVTGTTDLTARASKIPYLLEVAGQWHGAGYIEPGTYTMEDAPQWYVVTPPQRHGYRAVSYTVTKDDDTGEAVYEDGLLKLSPGCLGNVCLEPVWEQAGSMVQVTVRKDGVPWPDSGHTVSLVSDETVVGQDEALQAGGVSTWDAVGYGTYRIFCDGSDTGRTVTVTEGSPAEGTVDWWTVTAIAGEGIASVSGNAVLLSGRSTTLHAVTLDGRVFDSWREGGAQVSASRTFDTGPVTSQRTFLAVGFQIPEGEILPLGGRIFLALHEDNGAVYRFYDTQMNPVPQPWTVQTLAQAAYCSVTGNPEFPRFWIARETGGGGEPLAWGAFGIRCNATASGLGAGRTNTQTVLSVCTEEGSVWGDLPEGWSVGSRAEIDALVSAFPDLEPYAVWSSEESDRYGSWLRTGGQWTVAGKNTLALLLPVRTI